ncbi:MAG: hypothetical protein CMC55_00140 [Flavobacteriaceae bacterium]|nr:hypothetical protein [Flavobacteriaceae bacterium]
MIRGDSEVIREKVDFFMKSKVKVHIDLDDGTFLNGHILKKSRDNIYWLNERKLGNIFLFVKDIKNIREYKERGL